MIKFYKAIVEGPRRIVGPRPSPRGITLRTSSRPSIVECRDCRTKIPFGDALETNSMAWAPYVCKDKVACKDHRTCVGCKKTLTDNELHQKNPMFVDHHLCRKCSMKFHQSDDIKVALDSWKEKDARKTAEIKAAAEEGIELGKKIAERIKPMHAASDTRRDPQTQK